VASTRFNTLQHASTRFNTLQHASKRCNTLQHAAKREKSELCEMYEQQRIDHFTRIGRFACLDQFTGREHRSSLRVLKYLGESITSPMSALKTPAWFCTDRHGAMGLQAGVS
jgi:hypothetical protein